MKIGIVTLYGNANFGNKLQNYALQEYLKKLDHNNKIETIISYNLDLKIILKRLLFSNNYDKSRKKNFFEFNKLINYSNFFVNVDYPVISKKFKLLIFGSDQIWNCDFEGKSSFFSGYHSFNIKKISYAASFGKSFVDDSYKNMYSNSLNRFDLISVREENAKKIVENLTNRNDVEVLIDPTMLLNDNDWDRVCKKPSMLKNKKYILNYFLGNLSDVRKKEIDRVAKENNCEIINILDKNSPFYECGPSEFLYLEKNAFLICTDSFHSSVFAILYNKPFVVFDREQENIVSMNSRLDTLINKFKLKNRKFEGKITDENLNHDYSEAYKILDKERKKSDKFLKKALDIKD